MTLADTLHAEGGLLAAAVAPDAPADGEGPYAAVLAAIREGYEQHYGEGRVLRTEDRDLALLAGDRLYALGLARLAAIGDMTAIAELADVIALSAQAHAGGDAALADAAWDAGATAIGWGASALAADAKDRARAGDPDAADALRDAARLPSNAPARST